MAFKPGDFVQIRDPKDPGGYDLRDATECQLAIANIFVRVSYWHGDDAARRLFAEYRPHTGREEQNALNVRLVGEYAKYLFECERTGCMPVKARFVAELARKNGKSPVQRGAMSTNAANLLKQLNRALKDNPVEFPLGLLRYTAGTGSVT